MFQSMCDTFFSLQSMGDTFTVDVHCRSPPLSLGVYAVHAFEVAVIACGKLQCQVELTRCKIGAEASLHGHLRGISKREIALCGQKVAQKFCLGRNFALLTFALASFSVAAHLSQVCDLSKCHIEPKIAPKNNPASVSHHRSQRSQVSSRGERP